MGSSVLTPTSKVTTAAVVGAIIVIITWLVNVVFHTDPPVELGSLLNLVFMTAAAYIKRDKGKIS